MKVLHVSSGNLFGGVETLLATMARERNWCPGITPHFALCFAGRLSGELAATCVPITLLGGVQTRFPWQIWRARRRLAALLRGKEFDVMVCHMAWAQAIFGPVARRAGLPLVNWMHDVARGTHWIERWAAHCPPDLAVCNSRFTATSLPKLFPRRTPPCVVVHCPVSPTAAVVLGAAERAALRAEFQTPADARVIIQVGRMESYKGHVLHIDALKLLADAPDWHCWIVGGTQRPQEQNYLADLQARVAAGGLGGRAHFLGERRDVRRLLAAADIFCQPNLRGEPFGIVFIEALQAGLPVVTTALGGALEIVDETCGRLVAPGDPAALAEALRTLAADPGLRTRLGERGPARARELSDPALVLSHLEKCLELAARRA